MATAKPKVKRMMFGGAAKGVAAGMQGAAKKAVASKTAPKQMQFMSDQLRKLPMNPPMPGKAGPRPMQSAGRTVLGSPTVRAGMAGKSLMKKGGAVKKKATKK